MSFLKNIFKNNPEKLEEKKTNVHWIPLTSVQQIEDVKEASRTATLAIFKHSTRCGISRMVIKQFEKSFTEDMNLIKVYYLDVLNHREVSDEVGYAFQVVHQSPQILVVKNETTVAYASHYDILNVNLKSF